MKRRSIASTILAVLIGGFASSCTAPHSPGLDVLLLEGPELHASLVTKDISELTRHVHAAILPGNPCISSDPEFVERIARSGSQGMLDSEGMRSALFSLYFSEKELGFYGLRAESEVDAVARELLAQEIWAHNVSLDRARVHRSGEVVLVIWHDGVADECWASVNEVVAERLGSS